MSTCTYCGEELSEEERDNPRKDYADDLMCSHCYEEHFQFECCICGELEDNENRHNMVIVFEEDGVGVKPGVYRVKESSYFTVSIVGDGWIHEWAVERIGDVPESADGFGYPCSHACLECQKRLEEGANS